MNKNRIFVATTLFFLSCAVIKGMEERPGRYTLRTSNGVAISVSQDFVNKSKLLSTSETQELGGKGEIDLPNIDSETLRKLIAISQDIKKLEGQNEETWIGLANSADYLNMEELSDQIVKKLKLYYTSEDYLSTFARIPKSSFNDLNPLIQSKLAQNIMPDVIKFFDIPHLYKEFEISGLAAYSPLAVASAGIFIYHILPFAQREALRHITEIPQGLLLHIMQKNYEKSKKLLELNRSQSLFEIFNTLPENIRTYLQEAGWIEGLKTQSGGNIVQPTQKIASTLAGLR